jgi:hypothetical protein
MAEGDSTTIFAPAVNIIGGCYRVFVEGFSVL